MGRRKEPLERMMAKAKGNGRTPGGREIAIRESGPVEQAVRRPPAPRGLRQRGRLEWRKTWEAGFWLKNDQDYHWIEQIARAYDDIDTYREVVAREGLTVTGSQNQTVAHPLIAEIRRCEQTIRQCLSVLGFSPTDRAKLGLAEAKARGALRKLIDEGSR